MFYKLLGRVVWFVLTRYVRRRYGPTYVPKSVLAGLTVAAVVGVSLAVLKSRGT